MSSHGPFLLESGSVHQITLLARLIKHPTQTFFDEHLIPLITQTSVISLRALDWSRSSVAPSPPPPVCDAHELKAHTQRA